MNSVDKLIENTIRTKNPAVVGLDADLSKIPACYKNRNAQNCKSLAAVADVIFEFNRDIIDSIYDVVPAVKPQMAFYEKYGSFGVAAFEKTVSYAKSKGLVVIEDAKRNDIGNTAQAYADGHLGSVELLDGSRIPSFDADFLTVTPFWEAIVFARLSIFAADMAKAYLSLSKHLIQVRAKFKMLLLKTDQR